MGNGTTRILRDHNLLHGVVELVAQAREHVVLVSAYLDPWLNLETAIKTAVGNGATVTLVTRVPDRSKREAKKAAEHIAKFESLGARVHQVTRLHAKLYLNESEAVLTSMNLVAASRDSVEIGMHTTDPDIRAACVEFVEALLPTSDPVPKKAPARAREPPQRAQVGVGYCIGCGDKAHPFDTEKPLCRGCYRGSKRGTALKGLPKRVCHSCGKDHAATVKKPVCLGCYRQLSA